MISKIKIKKHIKSIIVKNKNMISKIKIKKHIHNLFQSMPKMPESEGKEETAESIAEKKEQVFQNLFCENILNFEF